MSTICIMCCMSAEKHKNHAKNPNGRTPECLRREVLEMMGFLYGEPFGILTETNTSTTDENA